MNLSDGMRVLPILLKTDAVPFLWGITSVGKTALVDMTAKKMGGTRIPFHLSYQDQPDLLGMMYLEDGRTKWALPAWWPSPETISILHFDEYNRCRNEAVLGAAWHMLTERRFHVHALPETSRLVASGNPSSGKYETRPMRDPGEVSRFCHLQVTSDLAEFVEYARSHDFHPSVTAFLKNSVPDMDDDPAFDVEIQPTRRGWLGLSSFLQNGGSELDEFLLREVAAGFIGMSASDAFMNGADGVSVEALSEMGIEKAGPILDSMLKNGNIDKLTLLFQEALYLTSREELSVKFFIDMLHHAPEDQMQWILKGAIKDPGMKAKLRQHEDELKKLLAKNGS